MVTPWSGDTRALGVWIETHDDDREAPIRALALAPEHGDAVVLRDPNADTLARLADALVHDTAPYLVFADAHTAIDRWSRAIGHVFEPARLGCLHVATALLNEGTRPVRGLPDLDALARELIGRELPERLLGSVDHEAMAARADAVLHAMQALTPRLRELGLAASHQLECKLVPAVVAMEHAGMGVDAAAFQRIADAWQHERNDCHDPDRIARLDKLISTYGYWPREFVRSGRIHARLHPLATDSGRFACTDPNLQQVPSEHVAPGLRGCFVPAPGSVLVIADYAQIELRVAAALAPCDALRQVFVEGRDPHRATASTITGKPEAEVSDHERKLAKAVNFGFLFGMGAPRFRAYARDGYGVELDEAEARAAKDAFFRTFPGVASWHRKVAALGREPRAVTVRTALGRRKRFEAERWSFTAALNIPVQGTAAEGFKRAMIALHPRLRAIGGRGVMCIHDEYIAEVPQAVAEAGRTIVEDTMREAMESVVPSVPIVAVARITHAWAEP